MAVWTEVLNGSTCIIVLIIRLMMVMIIIIQIIQFCTYLFAELGSQWTIKKSARIQTTAAIRQTQGQKKDKEKLIALSFLIIIQFNFC
jgi:hypothetical protein